jgi:asparagine synthase (glutamine-hydrolysing)
MAMAHAVEGRFPFLDHRVIELTFRMPPHYRLNGLNEKYILKKAAENTIPGEIVKRSKQPYRAPISECFFSADKPAYVDDLLSEDKIRAAGIFDSKKVAGLVKKVEKRNGDLQSETENMALTAILSTQLINEMFVENFPWRDVVEPENVKVYRKTMDQAQAACAS